ncbi:MAG: hypothetical protein VYE77_09850 [Planctomycetota bacterium]|nr:hypothetical protein [Planctomycetota bacterium]
MGNGSEPGGPALGYGINRGPGHVGLQLGGDSQGGVSKVMPLPPGQVPPDAWVPIATRLTAPVADPRRSTAAGGQGDTGSGGASWQLRVAPRHRAVVRRFFSKEEGK